MKLHFGEALKILFKTLPYIIVRIGIYGVIGIGSALYVGLLLLMAKVFGGAGTFIVIIGLALLFGILKFAQRYVLYLVKAGHIAVITELIHNGTVPEGKGQFDYGKQVVTDLFKEVSVLFAVDQIVDGTIKAFNRMVVRIADILPIPGLDALGNVAGMIVNYSVTYVDETILSFSLTHKEKNVWENAKTGLVLYAQNWKPILTNAAGLALVNIVATVAFIVIMLIPFGTLAALTSNETLKMVWLFLALAFGYGLKLAIVNPFCLIATIITFKESIEGQEPNSEWEAKLEQASDKFKELKTKAMSHVSSKKKKQSS